MSPAPCANDRSRRQVLSLGLAAALAPVVALAACQAPRGKVHKVIIANMTFGAPPTGLAVGDAIEWDNQDIFEHTATARDGQFDADLKPKTNGRTVLSKAGIIEVYCRFHPGMTLRLQVSG
jgi:plastocyanin